MQNNVGEIEKWLSGHNIKYVVASESAGELLINCPYCSHDKPKLALNAVSGKWHCWICGTASSNFDLLAEKFLGIGVKSNIVFDEKYEPTYDELPPIDDEIYEEHHKRLVDGGSGVEPIRDYLYSRGLSDKTIEKYKIGWDGHRIVIPVFRIVGGKKECINFRYKNDPTNPSSQRIDAPKMFSITGRGGAALFGVQDLFKPRGGAIEHCWIVEGEWDAMRTSQELGDDHVVVTSTGGKDSFPEHWIALFKKCKKIHICFDIDLSGGGQGSALKLAQKFKSRGVTVGFVSLGHLLHGQKKLDLSDYLKNHTRNDLIKLLESETMYSGENPIESPTSIISLDEIFATEYPANQWLVQGLILDGGINSIASLPGTMKSYISSHIAVCLQNGNPVFNYFPVSTTGIPILFVDKENTKNRIQTRMRLLGATTGSKIYYTTGNPMLLERGSKGGFDLILNTIQQYKIKLVVFDTLVRLHDGEENNSGDMNSLYRRMIEIREQGATILFLHHHNKESLIPGAHNPQKDLRGSGDIFGQVDTHFAIYRDKETDPLEIRNGKSRDDELLKPFHVNPVFTKNEEGIYTSVSFNFMSFIDENSITSDAAHADSIISIIRNAGEISRQKLISRCEEDLGIGRFVIENSIKFLVSINKISLRKAYDGKTSLYSYNPENDIL